jgi:nucleoside-diphosphate-sugar epimerase
MNKKDILVTGAGGFIGRYVVEALYNAGYHIVGLYRNIIDENPLWECMKGDLLEPKTHDLLRKTPIDLIVHCAAAIPKQFEGKEAEQAAKFNRSMDEFVLDLCKRKMARLIYLSASSIYGLKPTGLCSEESSVAPIGPYVEAKFYTEQQMFGKFDMDAVALRVSAPYGPGQKAKTVLKLFIERALVGTNLTYHGSGNRTQDFTFVKDVADAVVCAVRSYARGIYNIAGGHPISMRELAELVVSCLPGCKSQVIPSFQSDPQEDYRPEFDISKAKRELSWQPGTSLKEGVRQWIQVLMSEA